MCGSVSDLCPGRGVLVLCLHRWSSETIETTEGEHMKRICMECGKEFERYVPPGQARFYCSHTCYRTAQAKRKREFTCLKCGRTYVRERLKNGIHDSRIYCPSCVGKRRPHGIVEVVCATCGRHAMVSLTEAPFHHERWYCSQRCSQLRQLVAIRRKVGAIA